MKLFVFLFISISVQAQGVLDRVTQGNRLCGTSSGGGATDCYNDPTKNPAVVPTRELKPVEQPGDLTSFTDAIAVGTDVVESGIVAVHSKSEGSMTSIALEIENNIYEFSMKAPKLFDAVSVSKRDGTTFLRLSGLEKDRTVFLWIKISGPKRHVGLLETLELYE